jgi:ferredoxin
VRREGGQERHLPAVRRPDDSLSLPAEVRGCLTSSAVGPDLRRALASRGFNILLPLSEPSFDGACAPITPGITLRSLFAEATSAMIVASGGRDLFRCFRASPEAGDGGTHPLDRFTRAAVTAVTDEELRTAGIGYRLFFPFVDIGSAPALPFQRLGRAAGLGPPGPLGLQIHPEFGPWWAYRALIALAADGDVVDRIGGGATARPRGAACVGCPAPCVAACPAGAVRVAGFSIADCHARRLTAPACRHSCEARIHCVVGPGHRYTDEQLAFHMAASMPVMPVARP